MNTKLLYIILQLFVVYLGFAQKIVKQIDESIDRLEIESHLQFYASDEMRGRNTATIENAIAARYIAERFRSYGVKPVSGSLTYMQQVELLKTKAPDQVTLIVGDSIYELWKDLILITAGDVDMDSEFEFVGYGTKEDFEGKDFKGKIAIGIYALPPEGERLPKEEMVSILMDEGALGLIELYRPSKFDWPLLVNYLSGSSYDLATDSISMEGEFPTGWMVDSNGARLDYFKTLANKKAKLIIRGTGKELVQVPNVVGYIEGTDPKLKEEFVLISAHLDHVGVKNVGAGEDSIWNGARDNGIGITNMLTAAEFLGKNPPKRSIAFVACNAEEVGLLGSQWYVDHPLIPLEKTVMNINTDCGGYNDMSKVTVVGFERTTVKNELTQSAASFDLEAIEDRIPEENHYDRSDNVSFAKKGIPAVSYDPGYVSMDEEMKKYYHQPIDEPSTINYDYLTKYCKAYTYAVWLIANKPGSIWWVKGDKYEEAGKLLYNK